MIDLHMICCGDEKPPQDLILPPEVKLHIVDGNKHGPWDGRRVGFAQGDREWVTFADPDDIIVPGTLERIVEVIKNDDTVDMVGVNEIKRFAHNGKERYDPFVVHGMPAAFHHLTVFKRSKLDMDAMYPSHPLRGDMIHLAGKYLCTIKHVAYLDYPGYIWVRHPRLSVSDMMHIPAYDVLGIREEIKKAHPKISLICEEK